MATYLVFFVRQNNRIRHVGRIFLLASGVAQTLYIIARYLEAGNTPITSQHEAVVFFAWSTTWAYFSFRWRYTVKNFGTLVSLSDLCPVVDLLLFPRGPMSPLPPPCRVCGCRFMPAYRSLPTVFSPWPSVVV